MAKNEVGTGLAALLGSPAQEEKPAAGLEAVLESMREVLPAKPDLKAQLAALDVELKAAQDSAAVAKRLHTEASEGLKRAQDRIYDLQDQIKRADTRTDEQVNQEYIKSEIDQRFAKAEEQRQRLETAKRLGILTDEELKSMQPGLSPLAKAIGEKNKRSQQHGYR